MTQPTSSGSDGHDRAASGVPAIDVDPYSTEVLTDPYPFHHALREAGPVVWLEPHGVWATGRYEQVRTVLADWQTFMSGAGTGLIEVRVDHWREPGLLLESDPPEHTLVRETMERILLLRMRSSTCARGSKLKFWTMSHASAGPRTGDRRLENASGSRGAPFGRLARDIRARLVKHTFFRVRLSSKQRRTRAREGEAVPQRVQESIEVQAPPQDVFQYWANFQNFPKVLRNVEEVRMSGPDTSHWRVKGPLGKTVEFDAKTTEASLDRGIAWNSVEGEVNTSGLVSFEEVAAGRTRIDVTMNYADPPGGKIGELAADAISNPERELREDLENFAERVERGELKL